MFSGFQAGAIIKISSEITGARRGRCNRERRRDVDWSSARHAGAEWSPDHSGIFGRAHDDNRCHGFDLETGPHERLLPLRAIASGESGSLGQYSSTAQVGKGEGDSRKEISPGRRSRGATPSDRRPPVRQSGVGGLAAVGSNVLFIIRMLSIVRTEVREEPHAASSQPNPETPERLDTESHPTPLRTTSATSNP